MANGQGTAIIDFGVFPGTYEASIVVPGQATISATSKVEAYIMADDTATGRTASDHRYAALLVGLSCGTPVAATDFTIYGRSLHQMQGPFALRWVWTD